MRLLWVLMFGCAVLPALGQTPLRTLAGPQGGTIVFGSVDGANTPPAAMGSILKQLHSKYGNRPEVGRVFRVRAGHSRMRCSLR